MMMMIKMTIMIKMVMMKKMAKMMMIAPGKEEVASVKTIIRVED